MKSCEEHMISPMTADEAAHRARYFLNILGHAPETVAELITALADRALDTKSCPVALYNRYMLSVAFREELLPIGWYEPVGRTYVLCPFCSHFHPGITCDEAQYRRLLAMDAERDLGPSEKQLNDWNIHNDHADGNEEL